MTLEQMDLFRDLQQHITVGESEAADEATTSRGGGGNIAFIHILFSCSNHPSLAIGHKLFKITI